QCTIRLDHCFRLFFLLILPRPPPSTLFPYTTLFRSTCGQPASTSQSDRARVSAAIVPNVRTVVDAVPRGPGREREATILSLWIRSEEHTSELQSRSDLVCRLLLEKKKTHNTNATYTK